MTLEEFKQLQKCYRASLDLIIHGRPKEDDEAGDWYRRAAKITLKEFSEFIETHDPRQTPATTGQNHPDRGTN
jgi:hypothetical protein